MAIHGQHRNAVIDSAGLCTVILAIAQSWDFESLTSLLETATGAGYTQESVELAGERIWNVERLFNLAAGITGKDDTLPKRILEEPQLSGAWEGHVNRLGEMLPEFYRLRGWDEEGVPTQEKLQELGLA